jgi:hypothetical protein
MTLDPFGERMAALVMMTKAVCDQQRSFGITSRWNASDVQSIGILCIIGRQGTLTALVRRGPLPLGW